MSALPCIVCGAALRAVSDSPTQPYDGVGFTSPGHYGSTVFDLDGGFLALNVCDPCVTAAGERGVLIHGEQKRVTPETTFTPWPVAADTTDTR